MFFLQITANSPDPYISNKTRSIKSNNPYSFVTRRSVPLNIIRHKKRMQTETFKNILIIVVYVIITLEDV